RTFAHRDRHDGDISPLPAGRGLPLGEITSLRFSGYLVFKERDCFLNLLLCSLASRNPTSSNLLEDADAKLLP
ncbi:hypothetical protein, partial [Geobacillus sp. CAMR5420]|uniref:hypothetical protein n=1 Tax=Geobacillus sp. CAMR5420 TaxID=1482739 RepID=UPI0019D71273